MNLFNGTIGMLEKSLDYSTMRNRTISNNIANIDTPHYKAKDIAFKNVLNDSIKSRKTDQHTHPKHVSFDTDVDKPFQVINKNNTMYNHNGNNVDVDGEMAELAKNQIYYQSVVDRLNGKFNNIQTVIRGGR